MISVSKDKESLSLAAARLFAEEAHRAVSERGSFNVLLSGGETPRRCYHLLAHPPFRLGIPWEAVHFFWGDERWVPHHDPRSNYGMAGAALIDHLPLREEQIHPIPIEDTPAASAEKYETLLREYFCNELPRFDLVLLGLGEDGHTASLFPDTASLAESERWVCEVSPPGQELPRVTVTPMVLNHARLVAFLVAGSGKAAILKRTLQEHPTPQLPAQLIHPTHGRLLWLVDSAAASLLSDEALR